jgi:proteasome assembly chaperone (PAC2) family protein
LHYAENNKLNRRLKSLTININIVTEVELHEPVLMAAWPGMGHVALKAYVYLHEALRAQNLAFVEEPEFFRLPGINIQDGLVQSTMLPQLAEALLNFAGSLGVKRVITAAAMPTAINHYQDSRVWVTATHEELLSELSPYCDRVLREGQISGMNGLILGVAKQMRMEGFCFLGEIPFYTTEIENPKASKAVLDVLNKVLSLEISLRELEELASQTEKEIDHYLLELQQREQEEERQTEDQEGPVTVH